MSIADQGLGPDDPFIQTVKGPIAPETLGETLMHEHLIADWPWATGEVATRIENVAILRRVLDCLKRCEEAGVGALVDCGMECYGPSPLALLCLALQTPVHLICTTGVFAQDLLPPPSWAHIPYGPEDMAQFYIAAATDGQSASGVKPGMIKVAISGDGITRMERNLIAAAAIAQRATGLAITTHSWLTRWVEEKVDALEEAGADLDRVVVGHIGWGTTVKDGAMHKRLAKRGVNLGIDCVGSPARSVEENADIVLDLLEGGYGSQIVFSHDQTAYARGILELFQGETGWLTGDFTVTSKQLIPLLRKRGVDDKTLKDMMSGTPRRILTVDPARYPGAKTTLRREAVADPLAPYHYLHARSA